MNPSAHPPAAPAPPHPENNNGDLNLPVLAPVLPLPEAPLPLDAHVAVDQPSPNAHVVKIQNAMKKQLLGIQLTPRLSINKALFTADRFDNNLSH